MWSVRILSGPQTGQIFDLKLGKNVFGRGSSNGVRVVSLGISKEHCEIHVYKDKMMIVDLKSSNGTFVNGVKIQNSLVRVGDKISLFDIIMDLIPTPEIRPKNNSKRVVESPPAVIENHVVDSPPSFAMPQVPQSMMTPSYPQHGNAALQMNQTPPGIHLHAAPDPEFLKPTPHLNQRFENFIENVLMPAVYRLAFIFSFKQVLLGFVIAFVFSVTLLSMIPLNTILKESSLIEAKKRVRSVANAMAKINEQALLSGQLTNLSVQEALKEEGIKEAFIVQHSDGSVVAPSEKAGRESPSSFILQARKESRPTVALMPGNLLGASHPIGVYDPMTGEPTVKYHAVVIYDVGSLGLDQERIVSLFMQTLVIASLFGLMLYFLFARLVEFPIRSLNQQIDKALFEKTDRTEVPFEDPSVQQLVSNVNTLLNRVWSGEGASSLSGGQSPNRDLEYTNLVEIISHPALVLDAEMRIVAVNGSFEQLSQTEREALIKQPYQSITDSALVQNIEALLSRAQQAPYERHADRIPFSQFECDIHCQACLNNLGQVDYFILTLVQAEAA